jgi:uncharacterized protein YigA (DUF484 family)
LEETQKNNHVDMSQIEEFKRQEPDAIEENDMLAGEQSIDHEQTVETGVDSSEFEHVAQDELSEEESRVVAEENAKDNEELEEAARQWAEMMKKALEAEQSTM